MCEFIYPSIDEDRDRVNSIRKKCFSKGNICMNVTFVTCTHGWIRNSIKKSRLDRIENGHRRICLHLLDDKKFSFLSTCRLPVGYLTDGRKLNLSEIRFKYIATVQARTLYTVFVRLRDRIMKYRCERGEWREEKRKEKERKERKKKKKEEIFHLHADVFQRLRGQTVP